MSVCRSTPPFRARARAEEIEKLVTFPHRERNGGHPRPGPNCVRCPFGLSQVTLVFEEGTDIFRSANLE